MIRLQPILTIDKPSGEKLLSEMAGMNFDQRIKLWDKFIAEQRAKKEAVSPGVGMRYIFQARYPYGDGYACVSTTPIEAESKKGVFDALKGMTSFENRFVEIPNLGILIERLETEPENYRVLTLDEFFALPLSGDEWIKRKFVARKKDNRND